MSLEESIKNDTRHFTKTYEELSNDSTAKLKENGINTDDGSIAVLFSNVINDNLASLYSRLGAQHTNYFLSTAAGIYLEDKALGKSITRKEGESDDELRKRISLADRTNATGNIHSILDIVNVVEDVSSVIVKEFVQGAGSFEVIIRSKTQTPELLDKCYMYIKSKAAVGTKVFVNYPQYVPVRLIVDISTNNSSLSNKIGIEKDVLASIKNFVSNVAPGQTLDKIKLSNVISNSNSKITSSAIVKFEVNTEIIASKQVSLKYNEQFALSTDSVITVK